MSTVDEGLEGRAMALSHMDMWDEHGDPILNSVGWQFDPAEAASHNNIDIWQWDTPIRRGRVVANVKIGPPLYTADGSDYDVAAMVAELIARTRRLWAAPDLLAACEAALWLPALILRIPFADDSGDDARAAQQQIRAAIAKAKGETQ